MKKVFINAKEAFPTSKKHLIGAAFSLLFSFLFITFNLMGFNDVWYHDTYNFYFFEFDVAVPPPFFQSFLVFAVGFFVNGLYEFRQQKDLRNDQMPSRKDTLWDCLYFATSALIALWIVKLGIWIAEVIMN